MYSFFIKPQARFILTALFSLTLLVVSCTEKSVVQENKNKSGVEGYIKQYGGVGITTASIDGVLMLDCGHELENLGTTIRNSGRASSHALFVDRNADTALATVGVSFNSVTLANPFNSGLLSSFVAEPAQTPNSINWTVSNLNAQPFSVSDTPLQRIELPATLKAGDSLSLSGFSLNYTATSSIPTVKLIISYDIGYTSSFLGDTSTAAVPAPIIKTLPNTGTINLGAADLAGLRRAYYDVSLQYYSLDEYNGSGRRILLGKSYTTFIALVLQ